MRTDKSWLSLSVYRQGRPSRRKNNHLTGDPHANSAHVHGDGDEDHQDPAIQGFILSASQAALTRGLLETRCSFQEQDYHPGDGRCFLGGASCTVVCRLIFCQRRTVCHVLEPANLHFATERWAGPADEDSRPSYGRETFDA